MLCSKFVLEFVNLFQESNKETLMLSQLCLEQRVDESKTNNCCEGCEMGLVVWRRGGVAKFSWAQAPHRGHWNTTYGRMSTVCRSLGSIQYIHKVINAQKYNFPPMYYKWNTRLWKLTKWNFLAGIVFLILEVSEYCRQVGIVLQSYRPSRSRST